MVTEFTLLCVIAGFLLVISLLLLSVLKGIGETMDQRKDIFIKQYEWMQDIYNWIYKGEEDIDKNSIVVGDEENTTKQQEMFEEGIKEIEKINKEKSKNQDDM